MKRCPGWIQQDLVFKSKPDLKPNQQLEFSIQKGHPWISKKSLWTEDRDRLGWGGLSTKPEDLRWAGPCGRQEKGFPQPALTCTRAWRHRCARTNQQTSASNGSFRVKVYKSPVRGLRKGETLNAFLQRRGPIKRRQSAPASYIPSCTEDPTQNH